MQSCRKPGESIAAVSYSIVVACFPRSPTKMQSLYNKLKADSGEARVRKRVESAIAQALYDSPGLVGGLQDRGIRYDPRRNGKEPIECLITPSVQLLGLPDRVIG